MGVKPATGASARNHCAVLGGGEGSMATDVEMVVGGTVPKVPEDKEPEQGERKSVSAVSSLASKAEVYLVTAPLASRPCVPREATN